MEAPVKRFFKGRIFERRLFQERLWAGGSLEEGSLNRGCLEGGCAFCRGWAEPGYSKPCLQKRMSLHVRII